MVRLAREWSRRASTRGLGAPGGTRRVGRKRMAVDVVTWFVIMTATSISVGSPDLDAVVVGAVSAALHAIVGSSAGLYRGRFRLASFDEFVVLATVASVVAAAILGGRLAADVLGWHVIVSVLAPFAAFSTMLTARGIRRSAIQRRGRYRSDGRTPVIVFGAGDAGTQLINAMLQEPGSRYVPVALLDDDHSKAELRIGGLAVQGTRAELAEIAGLTGATLLIVAIPSASSAVLREITAQATMAGLPVKVLPSSHDLPSGIVGVDDIREVNEEDLLGRRPVETDLDAIAEYLRGTRVLVTGAGGSIGAELCRQILRFSPAQLVMVDRDESALHGVQLSIEGRALLENRNLVVADIRDAARVDEVFAEHRPDVVFHAAALKHLPLLELYPLEAWKTNVEGTNHVLRSAAKVGVTHFVNVSTDKAAEPQSVLGYTKRIAEQLTAWYAHRTHGDWVSVRFGNVLGTRGSVLETFRSQVRSGGPITVTHPDATRYFMTASEACQLVVQAAAVGHRGEALVLDMGDPIRILDVAQLLAQSASERIDIEFTGLRPGEKLHESLMSDAELDIRRAHPLISHIAVPALTPAQLGLFDRSSETVARESMARLCDDIVVGDSPSLLANSRF